VSLYHALLCIQFVLDRWVGHLIIFCVVYGQFFLIRWTVLLAATRKSFFNEKINTLAYLLNAIMNLRDPWGSWNLWDGWATVSFYLWVSHPVAHLSNWFHMMPSIATKFQYVNRFSTENLLILQFYVYNFYIYIQMITCIGNTKSRHRCAACNISVSGRVRATDPLY
jgi:hypothetical protein